MQAVEAYREKSFLFYDPRPARPLDDAGEVPVEQIQDLVNTIDRIETASDVASGISMAVDVLTVPSGEGVLMVGGVKLIANKAIKNAFEKQLKQHGQKSLRKSLGTIEERLGEHKSKLDILRQQGGKTSSVEREIRTFERQIEVLKDLLK